MGLGAGHMMDMNNRVKQNRDKASLGKDTKDTGFTDEKYKQPLEFKKLNEKELKEFRDQIQSRNSRNKKRELIIFLIAFLIVALGFFLFINSIL